MSTVQVRARVRPSRRPTTNGNADHNGYPKEEEKDPDMEDLQEEQEQEQEGMTLADFIDRHRDAITRRVIDSYPPLYQPARHREEHQLPELLRRPIGAQEHALRGTVLSLQSNLCTTIVGEMGTGKTFIGASAAHMAGFENILVLCPPHLVRKWKREIEITVPNAKAVIVESITDLERLRTVERQGSMFTILSRERAKLSYLWKAAYNTRYATSRGLLSRDEETGRPIRILACPSCSAQINDKEGIPISPTRLEAKRHFCLMCNGPLWEADHTKRKRYPLADYIKLRMKGFFDLLIADEVHEYKGQGTAQGIASGVLAGVCGKSLVLTGTLMGGYSSTLFHLLYRFSPEIRSDFQHSDRSRWIDRYGFRQKTYKKTKDNSSPYEHGKGSRRQGYRTVEKETPGLAPSALFHLIGGTIFLRLSDVTRSLPPYTEQIMTTKLSTEKDPELDLLSQDSAYWELFDTLKKALGKALAKGSKKLLGKYLQSVLAYPDGCTRGETVYDPEEGDLLIDLPPLSENVTYPKERALIDLVKEERKAGRRVLVYVTHTQERDITKRLQNFLEREGIRTAILKTDTTAKTEQREAWINERVRQGIDVLICNPRLVQTGLDLVDFPTICWYETDYSVYTMRQASRRSWRIGQTQPVKVVFMVYQGTLQADALKLIARKMQSSLAVEGELPEEGLVAYGDGQQDMIMALAKQIVNQDRGILAEDEDSVENIFARARDQENQDEAFLTNDEWAIPEIETSPEPTPLPTPEPAKAAKSEPAPRAVEVTGTEQNQEKQPALFSLTEFLAEPPAPNKSRKKVPSGSLSLFKWAVQQASEPENAAAN